MSDDRQSASDLGLKLAQLTALYEQGVLSDEEFVSAKQRIINKKAATQPPPLPAAPLPTASRAFSYQKPKLAQDDSGVRDTQPQGPPPAPVTERLSQWPKYWGIATGALVGLGYYGGLYGVRETLLESTFNGVTSGLANWGFLWLVQKGARAATAKRA